MVVCTGALALHVATDPRVLGFGLGVSEVCAHSRWVQRAALDQCAYRYSRSGMLTC